MNTLLTEQLRSSIKEYAALLSRYGYQGEAEYFRLSIGLIPITSDVKNYVRELLALIKLRRECYDIPADNPNFAGFLALQAQNVPTAQ